jgi:hypothetical protein
MLLAKENPRTEVNVRIRGKNNIVNLEKGFLELSNIEAKVICYK